MTDPQAAPTGRVAPPNAADRLRDRLTGRSSPRQEDRPPPWRVEGAKGQDEANGRGASTPRPSWRRFWWLLIVLLVVNWIISSVLLGPAARTTVAYTFFLTQVQAKNVAEVTSTGETIQGTFSKAVPYTPQGGSSEQVTRFTTERPTFANDNLFQMLP